MSSEPYDIPTVLQGQTQMIQPIGLFLIALFPLVATFVTFFGNHRPVHWQLITGVSVEFAAFLGLAGGGWYALRHPPRLEVEHDGVVIRSRITSRRIAWRDVARIGIKERSGEGVTFFFPTIEDGKGKTRRIGALMEGSRGRWRIEEAVSRLSATRDQQLKQEPGRE